MPINRLVNANQSPRCQHVKVNGFRCGSPARHGRRYCCFHDSAVRRGRDFVLPIVEDAASLQLALNKILQALIDQLIDQKTASILLYGLQIAFANLKQLKGEQRLDELQHLLRAKQETQDAQQEEEREEERVPSDRPITPSPDHPIQITNRKSQITNEDDLRFDIHACADDFNSFVSPCLRGGGTISVGDRRRQPWRIRNGARRVPQKLI